MKGPAEGGGAALVACRGWVLCIGCSLVVARCMGVGTGLELGSLHGPPSPLPPPIAIDVCFGGGRKESQPPWRYGGETLRADLSERNET